MISIYRVENKRLINLQSNENNGLNSELEIILGDRDGKKSYIRYKSVTVDEKTHTEQEFSSLVNNFYLTISDGIIMIKIINTNKVFLQLKDDAILKQEFKKMEVRFKKQNDKSFLKIGYI